MIWLAIRLTQLPLEAIHIAEPKENTPYGIVEDNQIICINSKAIEYGVKINHKVSTAYALCEDIQLYPRNLHQEQQKLNNLALLLYYYSSSICIESNSLISVEVGASLKLYHSMENLIILLKKTLKIEVDNYCLGLGNTPKSAELSSFLGDKKLTQSQLFRFWDTDKETLNIEQLHKAIAKLPISQLSLESKLIEKVMSVGIKKIGELHKYTQSSLRKRFGKDLVTYLLQLKTQQSDIKEYFTPQQYFSQKVEFIDVIHHREGLFFPIKKLIKNLYHYLTLKQQITQVLHWKIFDAEKNNICFDVLVTDNTLSQNIFFELTSLTLEHYTLQAPVEAIALDVDQLSELSVKTGSLLDYLESFEESPYFINKIRAKLGHNTCVMLTEKDEHLPEKSYQLIERYASKRSLSKNNQKLTDNHSDFKTNNNLGLELSKPAWLFESPLPVKHNHKGLFWQGELKIISSQERLTNYWWENKTVRDYFLARHDNGVIYWIFFEKINRQWFIHGIYS